jgi:NAD(P)H-dependent flavin oxidoreductase YrpB (nitropropane dioxygenase family)
MSSGTLRIRQAILEGNERFGLLPTGQSCGSMTDLPSCQDLIKRTVVEAEQALEKTREKFSS